MGIFIVQTYVAKSEKIEELTSVLDEFRTYRETHSELFSGVLSWRVFRQQFGGISGMYVEMWEFQTLADMERETQRLHADEGMKTIISRFSRLIEPASFSSSVWRAIA